MQGGHPWCFASGLHWPERWIALSLPYWQIFNSARKLAMLDSFSNFFLQKSVQRKLSGLWNAVLHFKSMKLQQNAENRNQWGGQMVAAFARHFDIKGGFFSMLSFLFHSCQKATTIGFCWGEKCQLLNKKWNCTNWWLGWKACRWTSRFSRYKGISK